MSQLRISLLFVILLAGIPLNLKGYDARESGLAEAMLDENNVRARILNTGGLFRRDSLSVYKIPKRSGTNTVFMGKIGIGGLVEEGLFTPVITHEPLPDIDTFFGIVSVVAEVRGLSAEIASVDLFYGFEGQQVFKNSFSSQGGDQYEGQLALLGQPGTMTYYIRAEDLDGQVSYLPEGAPNERFSFTISQDVTGPEISTDVIEEVGFIDFPLTIQAEVTDNLLLQEIVLEYTVLNASGEVQLETEVSMVGSDTTYSAQLSAPLNTLEKDGIVRYAIRASDSASTPNVSRSPESGFYEISITADGLLRQTDFESYQDDAWTIDGAWRQTPQVFFPVPRGPGNVIGTSDNENYPSTPSVSVLQFVPINLERLGSAYLSFWHFYKTENDETVTPDSQNGDIKDGGFVQIRSETRPEWTSITPLEGYPGLIAFGSQNSFEGESAFGGFSYAWRLVVFDLPLENNLEVRLVFSTDEGNQELEIGRHAGWFIDNLQFSTIQATEANSPELVKPPPPELIVDVDNSSARIKVRVQDETGVTDTFIDWTLASNGSTQSGTTRFSQEFEGAFFIKVNNLISSKPGDVLSYSIRLSDPFGNTLQLPGDGTQYSVRFRRRNAFNAIQSVKSSGAWFWDYTFHPGESEWSLRGGSEFGMSSLTLDPIKVPYNAIRAEMELGHRFVFGSNMAGRVDISTDNGKNWEIWVPKEGYPGVVSLIDIPLLHDQQGFVGSGYHHIFDLSDYRGERVLIRLLAGVGLSSVRTDVWKVSDFIFVFDTEADQLYANAQPELRPNYPNPFSARTNVVYVLKDAADVDIRVFDMLGREVDQLVSRFLDPGSHSVVFERGDLVSGIYFVRMQAGSVQKVRKIVIAN